MKTANTLRISFAVMYFFTSFVNLYLGITNPDILRGLASEALINPYVWFATNAPTYILSLSLLGFAIYQLILSFLLLNKCRLTRLGDRCDGLSHRYITMGLVEYVESHLYPGTGGNISERVR